MVTSNGHTVAALVTKAPTVDPVKDFSGVTRVGSSPLYLIVYGAWLPDLEGRH